jgi:O-antigen ligase
LIFLFGIGLLALIGWMASLSRGSIAFGGALISAWIGIELFGAWRESRNRNPIGLSASQISLAACGYLLILSALTMLALSSASLEKLFARGGIEDELQGRGRLELWRATFEGVAQTPWLGLGLAGAAGALNRYATLPMSSVAVWSHNDFVQLAAELGLVGSVLSLLTLAFGLSRLTVDWVAYVSKAPWSLGLMHRAALVGVLVTLAHGLVDFHLRIPLVGFAFLALLALAINEGPLLISPGMYARMIRLPRWAGRHERR